jgi:hypothetical protein
MEGAVRSGLNAVIALHESLGSAGTVSEVNVVVDQQEREVRS